MSARFSSNLQKSAVIEDSHELPLKVKDEKLATHSG
jgi:hypothetical protein